MLPTTRAPEKFTHSARTALRPCAVRPLNGASRRLDGRRLLRVAAPRALCHARSGRRIRLFQEIARMTRTLLVVRAPCLPAPCPRPAPAEVAEPPAASATAATPAVDYFDNSGRNDVLAGGEKMIEIDTPKGELDW